MMADFEQVDDRDAATDQSILDRCLRVTGEKRGKPPVPHDHDQRSVVDVAFRERRGCIGL